MLLESRGGLFASLWDLQQELLGILSLRIAHEKIGSDNGQNELLQRELEIFKGNGSLCPESVGRFGTSWKHLGQALKVCNRLSHAQETLEKNPCQIRSIRVHPRPNKVF